MAKIILFANKRAGLEVCEYLKNRGDEILQLYVEDDGNADAAATRKASGLPSNKIFEAQKLRQDAAHENEFRKLKFDFIVTVYWPYLIKSELFQLAKGGTVNFHPALLPINRGWYPHVHSILDGTPTGVSLHALEETADTGPVWAQKKVPLQSFDTAKTIHERLQDEIIALFKEVWPDIAAGKLKPKPQDESKAIYHKKSEVNSLDEIDLEKTYKARDLINRLRARSYGNKGFAYFKDGSEKIFMNLRLGTENDFQ